MALAKKQKKYDVNKVKIGSGSTSKQVSQKISESQIDDENDLLDVPFEGNDIQEVETQIQTVGNQEIEQEILKDIQDDMENLMDHSNNPFVEVIGEDEDEIKGFFKDVTIQEETKAEIETEIEEPVKQTKTKKTKAKGKRLAMIGFRNAIFIYIVLGIIAFVVYPRSDRKVIRPFDYVEVTFSGISQRGQADVVFIDNPEYTDIERELMSLMFKYYVVEPRFSLKSGQLVRVSLDTAKMGEVNDYLAQHNLRLDGVVKIVKVPKLPNYITNDDALRADAIPVFQQFAIDEGLGLIRNEFSGNLPAEGNYGVEVIKYYRYAREQFEGVVSNFAVVFKTSYKTTNPEGQEVVVEKYHIRYLNQIMYDAEGKVIFTKVDNFTSGEVNLDDIIRSIRSNYSEFQ